MNNYLKKNKDAIITTITSIFSIILALLSSFLYDYIKAHFDESFNLILIPYIIVNIYVNIDFRNSRINYAINFSPIVKIIPMYYELLFP